MEQFNKFNNLNFYLKRSAVYQESGRVQTEEEDKKIDKVVEGILIDYKIPFVTLDIDNAAKDIVDIAIDTLKKNEKV